MLDVVDMSSICYNLIPVFNLRAGRKTFHFSGLTGNELCFKIVTKSLA